MYKEKYLKYKTKYTALKNQLDSNYNIIQDGGVVPSICEPLLTYEEREAQKKANKVSLENGTLKVIDYVRKINYSPKTIIINPNPNFYTDNSIETYEIKHDILKKDESFIILTSPIDLCNIVLSSRVVGLLVNYLDENKFFVIEYVNDDLFYKPYQEVNDRFMQMFNIFNNTGNKPNYKMQSDFIVNITNLLKLFKECKFHIGDMQKAEKIKQVNVDQIIKEITEIIFQIEKICSSTNHTYNLLQLIELAEYIRDTS